MGARKRIRRTLALQVSERRPDADGDDNTPGFRFAQGWQNFRIHSFASEGVAACQGDPIAIAGYLAAQAAWNAHHHAVNWIEVAK